MATRIAPCERGKRHKWKDNRCEKCGKSRSDVKMNYVRPGFIIRILNFIYKKVIDHEIKRQQSKLEWARSRVALWEEYEWMAFKRMEAAKRAKAEYKRKGWILQQEDPTYSPVRTLAEANARIAKNGF